jgi:hypothetical protein
VCDESFRVGPTSVAEAIWKVLVEWAISHDGLVAGSHAMAQGDVEFELETDPYSKAACSL